MKAEVTKNGLFQCQVCVPENWIDEKVVTFANKENPSGTHNGWFIEKEGHKDLQGQPERVNCEKRKSFVHIMLEC